MSEEKPDRSDTDIEPEQKVAQQWLEGTASTLIRWFPLGGSSAAFISFLLKQNWFMAIAVFPVTIMTVIWAAYSKAFLGRLQTIYEEEGKNHADKFKAFTDNLTASIQWALAATEDKYLKCQGYLCQDYEMEGRSLHFVPQLEDVFVPLELSGAIMRGQAGDILPLLPGFRGDKDFNLSDGLRIWDLLKIAKNKPTYRRLLIKAWGGFGKTTLLRHITYTYTHKRQQRDVPKLLPVLLRLRKWQEEIAKDNGPNLPTLIEQYHIPSLPDGESLKLPPQWAKNQLKDGKMLILWDGFDEVKPEWRKLVSEWLGKQMNAYRNSIFILTSRPKGYDDGYASEHQPHATLFIKRFNRQQIEAFIQRWYLCQESFVRGGRKTPDVINEAQQKTANLLQQLDEREELAALATNPLLLNMIANIHRFYPSEQLPQRRTELYREIFRLQLGDRPLARQIEMLLSADESQQVLQGLALLMVQENKSQIEYEELLAKLSQYLNLLEESVNAVKFLAQIEHISEILVKCDDTYEFAHLSFQNYLAALEIERTKQEELLITHYQDSAMGRETTLLYGIQLRNPTAFIRRLCQIGTTEAVELAYKCLQETPRKVDETLAQEIQDLRTNVQTLRYQQLENYLKNQQWRKADEETYRLMITTVGKETGQFFEREDIENFPCEDLRTIDRLWVKYSNGHFGFSVQKKIWLELGGKVNYETECKLGDAVGWRKGEEWKIEEISFELQLTTPVGQLPFGLVGGGGWLVVFGFFSRAKTCNL